MGEQNTPYSNSTPSRSAGIRAEAEYVDPAVGLGFAVFTAADCCMCEVMGHASGKGVLDSSIEMSK